MGNKWRRFSEVARKKVGLGRGRFEPVSNARNTAMVQECLKFAQDLKKARTYIADSATAVTAANGNLATFLGGPKPRIWEESQPGHAMPIDQHQVALGPGFQLERFTASATTMQERLEEQVLTPIDQWLRTFEKLQQENTELEWMRMEVDSRRRTVGDLEARYQKKSDQMQTIAQDSEDKRERHEEAMNKLKAQKEHKQSKMETFYTEFRNQEAALYNQLAELIKDISYLPEHICMALQIMQESYHSQWEAVGNVQQPGFTSVAPVPSAKPQADPQAHAYNNDTAHTMPPPTAATGYSTMYDSR